METINLKIDVILTIIDTFKHVFNHPYDINLSYFDSYFLLFIVKLIRLCPKIPILKGSEPFGRHTEPLIVVHREYSWGPKEQSINCPLGLNTCYFDRYFGNFP